MTTVTSSNTDDTDLRSKLGVSVYDRISSLLLTLTVFVGFFVSLMFVVWFTSALNFKKEFPVIAIAEERGDVEEPIGYEDALEPPGLEEVEQISELRVEQTLKAVTNTTSNVAALFEPVGSSSTSNNQRQGPHRKVGPVGADKDDSIPRWERWEIHYASDKIDEYAKQLDHFKIELGAAGGGAPTVDYGSNFSTSPRKRSGPPADEKRLYMTWTSGTMKAMDRGLLAKAGVSTNRRVIMQFYP